jgi:hypothetical protein
MDKSSGVIMKKRKKPEAQTKGFFFSSVRHVGSAAEREKRDGLKVSRAQCAV